MSAPRIYLETFAERVMALPMLFARSFVILQLSAAIAYVAVMPLGFGDGTAWWRWALVCVAGAAMHFGLARFAMWVYSR